ncbi:T9SS type B sorting domain-containing protein [Nibrella saemangeumensis]|uniref:T9SS type B sorting domain-containing protein n=1 Tax=Nibrella saemangeumensis TaxID=1084526 RepID=UPI0031E78471
MVTTLTTRDDKTIILQYQVTGSGPVELHQKNAAGDYTPTGQTSTNGTFTVQTDAKKVQCFRVVSKDVCGNAASSEDMCSIVADAKAETKQNPINWTPYTGSSTFLRYRIFRNGAANPLTNIAERATSAYVDADNIDCNVQYCYSVVAEVTNWAGGRTIITSAPTCVTGIGGGDALGEIQSVLVSVEDNYPRLVVTTPAVGGTTQYALAIERSDGPNGLFQPLSTIQNTNVFRDETARSNERSYCYRVTYQNNCGMKSSPAPPVCTVWLTSKTPTAIDWTADAPFFPQDVSFYTVEFIDSLGRQAREHMNVGGNTHFEPDLDDPRLQAVRFRIIANAGNGTVSYSNFFELRQNAKIFAPDVFTPNGDGQNDEFTVIGKYWKKFTLTIFNRWGETLYQTTETGKGWDGLINGQPAEPGTYIYRAEIEDNTGVRSVKRGTFLLMR